MRQALTDTPTALAGITAGTRYTMQNRSRLPCNVQIDAAAPTDNSGAFVLGSTEFAVVRADSGDSIYVWVDNDEFGAGAVVYDEAP